MKIPPRCVRLLIGSCLVAALFAAGPLAGQEARSPAFAANERLGRGINMGNMLEAPREGQWGVRLQDEYFEIIAAAGFNSVRIPIRWSAHTASAAPFAMLCCGK